MDLIENEFAQKAIIRGGTFLFRKSDAIDLINKCKELNMNILGIESFEIINNSIKPKEILDCSVDESYGGHCSLAIEFIQQPFNQNLVFEVVYDYQWG